MKTRNTSKGPSATKIVLVTSFTLSAICFALAGSENRSSIIDAYAVGDTLVVLGPKHRILHVPMRTLPSLRDKSPAALRNFEIDPDGSFLYWPELDVHLGWNQFLQAVDPAEFRKAQQRSTPKERQCTGATAHRSM